MGWTSKPADISVSTDYPKPCSWGGRRAATCVHHQSRCHFLTGCNRWWSLLEACGHCWAFRSFFCMTTTTEAMKISELNSRQSLLIQQLLETTMERALIQKRDRTWWVDESDWRCGDFVSEKVSTVAATKKTRQPMGGLQNVDRGLSQRQVLEEPARVKSTLGQHRSEHFQRNSGDICMIIGWRYVSTERESLWSLRNETKHQRRRRSLN